MQSSFRKVLKQPNFLLLWISQIVSQFGDRLTQMALIGLVYRLQPSSPVGLAKIMSIPVIAVFLISPFAGVYVDRWNKKKTLWVSDLMRGIFILAIAIVAFWSKFLPGVYLLIFLSFCAGRFFIPAKMAVIPELVEEEQTLMANSLVNTTGMIAAMLGFGLGGMIVEKWGVETAFVIDAGTFLLSALLISLIRIKNGHRFDPHDLIDLGKDAFNKVKNSVLHEMKEGIKYIIETRETQYAAKIFSLLFSCVGALYVVFVVFIQDTFKSGTMDLGWFAVACGAGLFVGSILYGKLGKNAPLKRMITASLALISAWLLFMVSVLHVWAFKPFAFCSCLILGLFSAPVLIGVNTLIHNESKNEFWGRIFSSLEVVIHFAFIVWMFLASFLAEKLSTFTIIVAVGIIILIFAIYMFIKEDKDQH